MHVSINRPCRSTNNEILAPPSWFRHPTSHLLLLLWGSPFPNGVKAPHSAPSTMAQISIFIPIASVFQLRALSATFLSIFFPVGILIIISTCVFARDIVSATYAFCIATPVSLISFKYLQEVLETNPFSTTFDVNAVRNSKKYYCPLRFDTENPNLFKIGD